MKNLYDWESKNSARHYSAKKNSFRYFRASYVQFLLVHSHISLRFETVNLSNTCCIY